MVQALPRFVRSFRDDLRYTSGDLVPHRGHLILLGRPHEWQQFLEAMTGYPLVFTSRTH